MTQEILDLSVILPLHKKSTRDFEDYFDKCIKALNNQSVLPKELIIVHSNDEQLVSYLESFDFGSINTKLVLFDGTPNYTSQINFGVEKATTKWVSFYEFDDEYASIWFKNVKLYMDAFPEVQAFLPIVVDVDDKNTFAGFTNEATFAANFSQEMGMLTNETLLDYQNFQSSGMVIQKESFTDFGMFKTNFKLTFVYEFLLRMTYNSVQIMTIPKIGYKHLNMREDSIFWNYKFGNSILSENEVKFWVDSAKKEYFFTEERNINFQENEG